MAYKRRRRAAWSAPAIDAQYTAFFASFGNASSNHAHQQHQDYYVLLDVPRGADAETIKHAYHRLALRYHPDRNKGNEVECETKFKELAAAYAVLGDPQKRQQYDLSLLAAGTSTSFTAASSSSARFFHSTDLREVFNQFVSSGSTTSFSDFFGSFSSRSFSSFSSTMSSSSSSSMSSSNASPPETPSSPSPFSPSSSMGSFGPGPGPRQQQQQQQQQGLFSFNKKRPPAKGQNLRTTIHVTFAESVFGCTKTIALKTMVWCGNCRGLGIDRHSVERSEFRDGQTSIDCTACSGTGIYSQRSSVVTINSTCGACDGKGVLVDETTKCKCCHNGRIHQTKELRIEVPAGVMNNTRKIYEGEGDVGEYGGVPGDLIVIFDVEESPLFTREGDDAMCDVSIDFFQAALGTPLLVPGMYGHQLKLEIPPGSQPHDVLRIEDEGFINVSTRKRGHLYVRLLLTVPKSLTSRQAELLMQAQHYWNQADIYTTTEGATMSSPVDTPAPGDTQSSRDRTSPNIEEADGSSYDDGVLYSMDETGAPCADPHAQESDDGTVQRFAGSEFDPSFASSPDAGAFPSATFEQPTR